MSQRTELSIRESSVRHSRTVSGYGYLEKCAGCLWQVGRGSRLDTHGPSRRRRSVSYAITSHVQQHLGLARENQEDTAAIVRQQFMVDGSPVDTYIFQISDGCGGMAGGEIASLISCKEILKGIELCSLSPPHPADTTAPHQGIGPLLEAAYQNANLAILKTVQGTPQLTGMASTAVSVVVLDDGQLWIAWAGDSRAYRYRRGRIDLLTKDHNRVRILVDEGIISDRDASTHPARNQLTNALGMRDDVVPEIVKTSVEPGDLLILSTDGFHEGLSEEAMCQLCADHLSAPVDRGRLRSLAAEMEAQSLNMYGGDNLTAILAYVQPRVQSRSLGTRERIPRTNKEERS